MKWMRWVLGSVVVGTLMAGGCAKKGPPATQPAETAPLTDSGRSELELKMRQLSQCASAFADTAEQMANRGDQDHRVLVEQSLTELLQVLPLLAGPDLNGGLNQRMTIIQSSRDRLQDDNDEPSAGPAISTALRSAAGALESIAEQGFAGQSQVADMLRQLNGKIAELDTVHGAIHRLVVTQCMGLMSQAVTGMSQTAIGRWRERIQMNQPAGSPIGE